MNVESPYQCLATSFSRRATNPVQVGNITIGGDHPIVIQSMITEETGNTLGAVAQIRQLHEIGSEIVRVTTPTLRDAQNLAAIKQELKKSYMDVPLVADVHHQGADIAIEAARYVEKVRINPGLFVYHKRVGRAEEYTQDEIDAQYEEIDRALQPVIRALKDHGRALRLGANHGSLAERLLVMYGDTPLGMVESVMEYLRILERNNYHDTVISLKASTVPVMIEANRLMVKEMEKEGMNYPLHLGVTEAGNAQEARIKSTLGIGTLLAEGIGDTIRVSLAEDPINEIEVCRDILQGLGLHRYKMEFIACPGCGRTKFDLAEVSNWVKETTKHLKDLKIAVMGCIVNGLGEMADADYGFVGLGGATVALYRGKRLSNSQLPQLARHVSQEESLPALIELIKSDGYWQEPKGGWVLPSMPPQLKTRIQFP